MQAGTSLAGTKRVLPGEALWRVVPAAPHQATGNSPGDVAGLCGSQLRTRTSGWRCRMPLGWGLHTEKMAKQSMSIAASKSFRKYHRCLISAAIAQKNLHHVSYLQHFTVSFKGP
jgi:hypothetical protein